MSADRSSAASAAAADEPARPVGFVGLGLLGQAMALRLVSRGIPLVVWNREAERSEALAAAGARVASSPREVALACESVCLCVLDGAAVESVVVGPQGLACDPGRRIRTVIDFSTVPPDQTRAIAARAAAAGISWVDAPVSGGPALAREGRLAVMVGGDPPAVAGAADLLARLAAQVEIIGGVGAGQEMKQLNQALVGGMFVMLAEALALARARGLPLDRVPTGLAGGLADSVALQKVWPRMVARDFDPPTGYAGQMLKDLEAVEAACRELDLDLPLVEVAVTQYRGFVERFGKACETVSISRLYAADAESSGGCAAA